MRGNTILKKVVGLFAPKFNDDSSRLLSTWERPAETDRTMKGSLRMEYAKISRRAGSTIGSMNDPLKKSEENRKKYPTARATPGTATGIVARISRTDRPGIFLLATMYATLDPTKTIIKTAAPE